MRRVVLLALLALVFPTAALAGSVSFFASSMCLCNKFFLGEFTIGTVVGSNYTISLVGGPAMFPSPIGNEFTFNGGTITVTNTSTGAVVFQSKVIDGSGQDYLFPLTIIGSLENGGSFDFAITQPVFGNSTATVDTVPEPTALDGLMLGTGLIGLAEMVRRKLKLGS